MTDANGNDIQDMQVQIISGFMGAGYGYTDETGSNTDFAEGSFSINPE